MVKDSATLNAEDETGRVSDKPVEDVIDDWLVVAKLERDDSEEVATEEAGQL